MYWNKDPLQKQVSTRLSAMIEIGQPGFGSGDEEEFLMTATEILEEIAREVNQCARCDLPVSYTHLTLPTNREV